MRYLLKNRLLFFSIILYSAKLFSQSNEKIIFQTDRDIYIAGEEVLVNAFYCSPNNKNFMSNILYVEIFDKENNIVAQKKLEINNGIAFGNLYLPKSTKTDVYFTRAYTKYLTNFSPIFYQTRKIICVNPLIPPNFESKHFSDHHEEMLYPSEKVDIDIRETSKLFIVKIELENKFRDYWLKIYSEDYNEIEEIRLPSSHHIELSKSNLPFGIIYFTLRNSDGETLSVLPIYNWPITDDLNFNLEKSIYKPREKVELTIENGDLFNCLSVKVVNKGALKETNTIPFSVLNNISLLRGYLHENHSMVRHLKDTINFYLNKEGIRLTETKKIEKIIESIYNNDMANKPEIIGSSITGRLVNENNLPVPNTRLFLSVFEGNKQFHSTITDSSGLFYFSLYPNTYSTNRLLIRTQINESQETKILIDYDYSNQFIEYKDVKLDIDSADKKSLEELFINQQINERTSSYTKPKNSFNKQISSPDYLITLSDYINLPKLEEVFDELVPHVSIRKKNRELYLNVFDETRGLQYDKPLLLLDFAPIFNIEEFLKIPPLNVKSISVINKSYRLGETTYRGIINVTTKNNNFSEYPFPEDVAFLDFEGVSFPYNFNNVLYADDKSKQTRIPDFRTVLYWNPNVKTDSVSFYTSDHCSDYQIVVTGIDKQGRVVKSIKDISIKQ